MRDECNVTGKLAGRSAFRVRKLPPPPFGTVGGFGSGSTVAQDVFWALQGLGVYDKDFPFEVKYKVTGFTFSVDYGQAM